MSTHPMVTRAKAGIFKPLERMNCHVTTTSPLPRSHVHALRDPNWKEAMLDEYNALITNGTWVLVPRPANVNVVHSIQQQGIDCDETFSPVVKPATIRTVLSLVVSREWPIHQLDVKNRSLVGALSYLTFNTTKPSYVVQHVCLYMHDPRDPHFTALKCIIRYVRGTIDHGLQLHVSFTAQLTAYTDADWAGCPVTRRVSSVANVVDETVWLRNLLLELHAPLSTATIIYYNVSAVYLSTNSVQHQRTKHIEIDIHFVRDYVASGQVRVLHVPSRYQYADIFTKGLPSAVVHEFSLQP
ncbi:ribonuclease H-like domain-containing protein [Tanacetum coccineum]